MPKAGNRTVIVAYIPVLHRGYLQFFESNRGVTELYIIGEELLKKIDYIRKDLRALVPQQVIGFIKATRQFDIVTTLSSKNIPDLDSSNIKIIMPDEDISRAVGLMFKRAKVSYCPIFLRWDRRSLEKTQVKDPDEVISSRQIDKDRMQQAYSVATTSSDIWRRVGALLLTKKGKKVGLIANQGQPSSHTPWIEGDPRNIFSQGVGIDVSIFMHSEAALVAMAAKDGVGLDGGSMYVTTFPCPLCAKLIAHSGIKNLYYSEGYGVLDGKRVLQEYGVKIKRVPLSEDAKGDDPRIWVPYKKG